MKPVKNVLVTIRLTDDQYQHLKDVATSKQTTMSKLIREKLIRLK